MAKNDTLLIMNTNDEDVDLGLALGSTSNNIQSRVNSSSGAGVNANLIGDMAFGASDPLAELVWLPHKGLSLKCADSSISDKKPFLLWDVEPSSKVLSPSQMIRPWGPEDDRVINVGRSTVPQTFLNVDSNVDDKVTSASPLRSSPIPMLDANCGHHEEINAKMEEGGGFTDANQEEEHLMENIENLCSPHIVQIVNRAEGSTKTAEQDVVAHGNADCKFDMPITGQYASNIIRETCSNQIGKIENIASGSEIMRLSVVIGSEPCPAKLSEALLRSPPNIQSTDVPDNEVTSATMNNVKMLDLVGAPPLLKLGCTAENDLYHPTAKDTLMSSEERLPRCNSLSVEKSPTNCRIQMYWEKGKEKSLSDGDDNGRSTNVKEESHKSAESCNSTGLFSKVIKRLKCDQELIVESKRMKKQEQGTHASTSIVNHDSSFMNWIANMVKGIQDFNKEASPSLALTLVHSNDFDHQETIMFDKTHGSKSQNIGFQAMFQSLYCSNTKIPDSGFLNENYSIGESKDCMVAEETFLESRPRSCHMDKDSSFKQIALSNEKANLPISRNIVGLSSEPWILSVDFACETNTEGNKDSNDLVIERGKDGISSSGSLCKHVDSTAENSSLNFPLEGKETSTMPYKSSPLSSLWITRLSVKTPELENCNRSTDQVLDCSPDTLRVNPNTQYGAAFPIDQESSEMKNFAAYGETSVSNKSINKLNSILPPPNTQVGAAFPIDQESSQMKNFVANDEMSVSNKSINKLNPILPPPKFESSEAMASVFARRLNALRYIIPSDKTKSSTCTSTMCYFCGKIGHDLCECPDVTEIELKNLVLKISSFDRVEETGCLCIRCSQLDHWANTCPLASSSGHCPLKRSAAFIDYSSRNLMFCSGNEKYSSYLRREEENSQLAIDQKAHSLKKLCPDYTPSNPMWGANEFLGKRIYEVKKRIASNSENDIKEDPSLPLCKVLSSQNENAPVEMFHAIRNLRLSRVDILRWMNSPISQSQLNGFFLRLRLGKWINRLTKEESQPAELGGTGSRINRLTKEESQPAELGGTGYYVACITGSQRDNLGSSSKNSIFADVEGIKYSVESQYVSNHDFSEEEIKTWWCRIVKAGGKIPSIDELKSKLEERKILGF